MKRFGIVGPLAAFVLGVAVGCDGDTAPDGLGRTPRGPGARVVFDTTRRPLPEVPLPNDIATFADPTSRTGLRVNVSMVAPTQMERTARTALGELEGWGTYAPISASFSKSPLADPREAALDLQEIRRRMPKGDFDFADDPVYLVNLTTGVPVVLDMGSGSLPVVLREPGLYWANDPHATQSNLLFETREEGAGLTQAQYRPELDTDFDGVLDHPNTFGIGAKDTYDNLLTWYERETDTLILRPLVPMDEKTKYAVVFTDRLRGSDGRQVLSPYEYVHHAAQREGAARVREIVDDPAHAKYFGDIASSGLDHVAFVWTFTTQPVHEDLRLLRDGLYGKGPFARFASDFPAKLTAAQTAGDTLRDEPLAPDWQAHPKCAAPSKKPFVFDLAEPSTFKSFTEFLAYVADSGPRDIAAISEGLSNVSHIISGEFDAPYLIGDPANERADDHFHLNFQTGEGDVNRGKVHFLMIVPKETAAHKQPFPISVEGHGYGGSAADSLLLGGELARRGIASVAVDMPHHGLALPPAQENLLQNLFLGMCYAPFSQSLLGGRAQDLNGDGVKDSGWWFWTSHLFHVRDNVRQAVVDFMQLSRILATFDGHALSDQDFNGDGKVDLAGDFDGNGLPDVGGPITGFGASLGGITTQILGGLDHQLTTLAPAIGGGGLTDVGLRSYGVANSVVEQTVTPLVVALPASERPDVAGAKQTNCASGDRSLRFVLNDGRDSPEVEIACLRPDEIAPQMTVLVTNVTSGEVRCAGTSDSGRFRVSVPASLRDRIDVQVYTQPHAVVSYGTCELVPNAPVGRRVTTFEQPAPTYRLVASDATCDSELGCAQFLDRFFPVGSTLVAPQEGLGIPRQSPLFRRFYALGQAVLDTGDPINFAPYYGLRPLLAPDGTVVPPRGLLNVPSVGDNYVAVHTEIAFGRAAGMVPFLPPELADRYPEYREYATPTALYDELGHRTPNQVLVESFMMEGISRLERTPAGPACKANTIDAPDCKKPLDAAVCRGALNDIDWVSEGRLPFDQQHPARPLRLARRADLRVADRSGLDVVWQPRTAGTDVGFAPGPPIMAQLHFYSDPEGTHAPAGGACSVWDPRQYVQGLVAQFLATRGSDVLYISRPHGHQCLVDHSCDFTAP